MPEQDRARASLGRLQEILAAGRHAPVVDAEAFGLNSGYWAKLSERDRALYAIVRPLPTGQGGIDISLHDIESHLLSVQRDLLSLGGCFELEPDFQRGHVWTDEQRVAYVEALLRGQAPSTLLFNCPGWVSDRPLGNIPVHTFQCVDGLQRLTAVMGFARGELAVFGGLRANDFDGTPFSTKRVRMQLRIMEFSDRATLLDFYLRINAGGTVHSDSELSRVRALMLEAVSTAEQAPARHDATDRGVDRPRG